MRFRDFSGLPIIVENAAGSTRQWHDRDGRVSGETLMKHDYGFIEGHIGTDGDEVDCYLGPKEEAQFVYVVHQLKSPEYNKHDEDKVMLGFSSEEEAKKAYLAHRKDGDQDPGPYGGMSVIPLEDFKRKLQRRTGTGKIRHEVESSMSIKFEVARGPDGKLRVGVWDKFTTWGTKYKDGMDTRFDEETLTQFIKNWKERGDALPMDYNHQSSYASENGQPAPALAWYDALAIVRNGQCIGFDKLDSSGAQGPPESSDKEDGLYGYRSEVTELGQELLPNFKYISPTFSPDGTDEMGNDIGYTLHAVAATNTPFQAGTEITFSAKRHERKNNMARFEEETMKKLGLEAGADDEAVKQAYAAKMEEAKEMLAEEDDPDSMKKMAAEMEELAKHYEAAYEEGPEAGPHVVMKKLAKKLAKMAAGDSPFGGKETPEEEAAEGHKMEEADGDAEHKMEEEEGAKMEEAKMEKKHLRALANRMGVRIPDRATSRQMYDAISAATVPAAQLPILVDARVKQAMLEKDQARAKEETRSKAKLLVEAMIEGGYPEDNRKDFLNYASDPKNYASAEAIAKPFLKTLGDTSVLFSKLTASGAPTGIDPRREGSTSGGKDQKVVRSVFGNFIVDGERFSNMAKEMADAKDGKVKMEIDAMLSDTEQNHSGYRLIAANRLLRQQRPDLWAAAEENDL